jgi:hypothetical protein
MSLTKTVGLFVGTTLAATGVAFGSTEANSEAMQEIAKLKEEIALLKSAQGDQWLTEARASEIKGLVQDVLADADTRASLQGAGSTAGWDNGFFLSSADGNFRLNISGGAQMRWTINNRSIDTNNPVNAGLEDTNWGFQTHAASLTFSGHIVDPSWQYKVNANFFTADGDYSFPGGALGSAYLNEWWVLKDFGGFYVKAGQFTAPYSRERLLSDYSLQFLSRSNNNYAFGLGQTQGIEAGYLADMFRIAVAYADGLGTYSPTENAGYPNPFGTASPGTDFALVGRAEVKIDGTWKQFQEQQSWRGSNFGLLLGLGAYWQDGGGGLLPPPGTAAFFPTYGAGGDQFGLTADATAQFGGFNLAVTGYYFHDDDFALGGGPNPVAGNPTDSDGYGFTVEGGFFVTDEFEIVGRYEYGDFSNLGGYGVTALDNNLQSTVSGGVNWYFGKNRAKWQTDIGYAFYGIGLFGANGNGWLQDTQDANGNYEDGQFMLRTGVTINF